MHPLPNSRRPERGPGGWTVVHTAAGRHQAEIVAGRLEAEGMNAVVLDLEPGPYPLLGDVHVLVAADQVVRALHLLQTPAP